MFVCLLFHGTPPPKKKQTNKTNRSSPNGPLRRFFVVVREWRPISGCSANRRREKNAHAAVHRKRSTSVRNASTVVFTEFYRVFFGGGSRGLVLLFLPSLTAFPLFATLEIESGKFLIELNIVFYLDIELIRDWIGDGVRTWRKPSNPMATGAAQESPRQQLEAASFFVCVPQFPRLVPSFTEFYRVLPSFPAFCRIPSYGSSMILPSFTGFYIDFVGIFFSRK